MKLFIVLIALLFNITFSSAQVDKEARRKIDSLEKVLNSSFILTPVTNSYGEQINCLDEAGRRLSIGLAFSLFSTFSFAAGFAFNDEDNIRNFSIIGLCLNATSIGFCYSGYNMLRKAGRQFKPHK